MSNQQPQSQGSQYEPSTGQQRNALRVSLYGVLVGGLLLAILRELAVLVGVPLGPVHALNPSNGVTVIHIMLFPVTLVYYWFVGERVVEYRGGAK